MEKHNACNNLWLQSQGLFGTALEWPWRGFGVEWDSCFQAWTAMGGRASGCSPHIPGLLFFMLPLEHAGGGHLIVTYVDF